MAGVSDETVGFADGHPALPLLINSRLESPCESEGFVRGSDIVQSPTNAQESEPFLAATGGRPA